MNSLMDTSTDQKNIDLVKVLHRLRQDLDIYCLIAVNAGKINDRGQGKGFFGHTQQLALASSTLGICKIFEEEKQYKLNSISGIINNLLADEPSILDHSDIEKFISKHNGPSDFENPISALEATVNGFKAEFETELDRFKNIRDKWVAHSEFDFDVDNLPSYDVMEKLFDFGYDFYCLVSSAFVGTNPADLTDNRPTKYSLTSILQDLGFTGIQTDME